MVAEPRTAGERGTRALSCQVPGTDAHQLAGAQLPIFTEGGVPIPAASCEEADPDVGESKPRIGKVVHPGFAAERGTPFCIVLGTRLGLHVSGSPWAVAFTTTAMPSLVTTWNPR